jgi:hypothetical protein
MSDTGFDFAVFGSTPLAQLLAGLLASAQGRKVLLVGESQAGYRLVRGIDLSVAPVTRPETWAMLIHGAPETARLVSRIGGRAALTRVDPIFFAQSPEHGEALSHVRHMAAGFGLAAEPVAPSLLGAGRSGVVLRDAIRINRPILEAGMDGWLDRSGVSRVVAQRVEVAADGQVHIVAAGSAVQARQSVLCDDEAIMAWLPLRQWPQLLWRSVSTSILTAPTQPLPASIMLDFDSGTCLIQQAEGGVAACGPGDMAELAAHLHVLLGESRQVEQAGQTSFQSLATRDGAPAFGRVGGVGADVVAGLSCYGAFLAPALARWLSGTASAEEAAWFGARLVNRGPKAPPVDDYVIGAPGAVA